MQVLVTAFDRFQKGHWLFTHFTNRIRFPSATYLAQNSAGKIQYRGLEVNSLSPCIARCQSANEWRCWLVSCFNHVWNAGAGGKLHNICGSSDSARTSAWSNSILRPPGYQVGPGSTLYCCFDKFGIDAGSSCARWLLARTKWNIEINDKLQIKL